MANEHGTNLKREAQAGIIDPRLLEVLVCPITRSLLQYDKERQELISQRAMLAFPIRDGIPILLHDEARKILD